MPKSQIMQPEIAKRAIVLTISPPGENVGNLVEYKKERIALNPPT